MTVDALAQRLEQFERRMTRVEEDISDALKRQLRVERKFMENQLEVLKRLNSIDTHIQELRPPKRQAKR